MEANYKITTCRRRYAQQVRCVFLLCSIFWGVNGLVKDCFALNIETLFLNIETLLSQYLAVIWQLYWFPCDWLTTFSTLLKNTTTVHSERLVTHDSCNQIDEETWPDLKIFKFLKKYQILGKISNFRKNFRVLEDFQSFGGLSEDFQIFQS